MLLQLQVKQDGFFPADLLLLAGTNADGVCYVEVSTHSCIFPILRIFCSSLRTGHDSVGKDQTFC